MTPGHSRVTTVDSALQCMAISVLDLAGLSFVQNKGDEPTDGHQVSEVLTNLPSWSWWTARVLLTNQRLLNRSAATLRSALSMLMPQVVYCLIQ